VIPNFVNCDLYTRKPDESLRARWAPGGEPIVMHLSNFRPVKRVTDAVEIFAQVRAKMPAKLVLIGDGPERGAAEYLVRKKKLQKDVHFLGKQDQVYRLLSEADLFLLPSQLESFGLAALEAMACEVPVIATNVGGVPEVIEHGVDGFLVEPEDVATAARYAIDVLSAPTVAGNWKTRARQRQEKFCANDVIPAYERYYQRILSESRALRPELVPNWSVLIRCLTYFGSLLVCLVQRRKYSVDVCLSGVEFAVSANSERELYVLIRRIVEL